MVDVPRIAPHVGHRVGAGAGHLHEARDILEGAVGLHVGRQIGDATDDLADHGPRDVGIAGIPGPLEFDRLQHAVADVGIRPGTPVEPGEEHVGAGGQHELCGAGIERRGVAVDVDVGHVPVVIVEIRSDAVSCVDRGLRVAGRGHQRVRGEGDVADGVGGVGDREWRHHGQGQPILQPLGLLQIAEPVAASRNGSAPRQFLPGLNSPWEKCLENVHGGAPVTAVTSAQRCSVMPKNKKADANEHPCVHSRRLSRCRTARPRPGCSINSFSDTSLVCATDCSTEVIACGICMPACENLVNGLIRAPTCPGQATLKISRNPERERLASGLFCA